MKLECANCGTQYPGDLAKKWGKTQETNGYGPQMVCIALVPNGQPPVGGQEPREVCRGLLGAITDESASDARILKLTENA